MKKSLIVCGLLILSLSLSAQNGASNQKTQKELEREIKRSAPKRARKEAKILMKDDFKVPAGALPLDKQLEMAWEKQYEIDDRGFPKYIIGNGASIGTNYSAAKNQATNLAKVELAGLISSQIASLAENSVANQDLSQQEAASVVKTVEASKNIIAQELGRVLNILEVYRTLENKNVEVQVRLAYSSELATEVVRKKLVQKLEDETKITHDKLEKMMNLPGSQNFKKNSNAEDN
jgi:hypothetical protein